VSQSNDLNVIGFSKRLLSQKVCASCSKTSYKIVLLTYWNNYLDSDTSETEVNVNTSVNNDRKKILKEKHCDFQ